MGCPGRFGVLEKCLISSMRLSFLFLLGWGLLTQLSAQNCDPRHTPISEDDAWRVSGMKACCEAEEEASPYRFSAKLIQKEGICCWALYKKERKGKKKKWIKWKQRTVWVDAEKGQILGKKNEKIRLKTPVF